MSSEDLAIQVENLSKRYEMYSAPRDRLKQFVLPKLVSLCGGQPKNYHKEFWALRDVSFEVRKGEAVGIVGRNGSGKSTLLQIVTGTLAATSGSVIARGRIAALLELGSGFNPEFSGRENVFLNGAVLGLTREQIDERFDSIAGFADIGEYLDQPVKTYSSGMMLRLAFAVQVQVEPEILIVDEALAVGDALFQKRCFQRIERLVSDGTSLLFVSHDQESIRTLTNRALLLHGGRSVSWGLSSEVVLEYRRLLHDEEAAYFTSMVKNMAERKQLSNVPASAGPGGEPEVPQIDEFSVASPAGMGRRSERLSFGDGEVEIVKVETLNGENDMCTVFYPRDLLRIRITCRSNARIKNLNVAVRIRNKEGVKIYSWGTLNQDMGILAANADEVVFWEREFLVGEVFHVVFNCPCNLGVNLYEIQACVAFEETPDYLTQRVLHWIDEAAFFQVNLKRDEYFFGGVADLRMTAEW